MDECRDFNQNLYEKENPGEKIGFMYDGPVDPDNWNTKKPKVVFLCKEHYGWQGCDSRYIWKEDKDFNGLKFYKYLAAFTRLFEMYFSGQDITGEDVKTKVYQSEEEIKAGWKNVAMIEVKKISGDGQESNGAEVREHARKNNEFLTKQLKMLDPDIIFCCGQVTFDVLTVDLKYFDLNLDELDDSKKCYKFDNKYVINSCHPSKPGFNIVNVWGDIVNCLKSLPELPK